MKTRLLILCMILLMSGCKLGAGGSGGTNTSAAITEDPQIQTLNSMSMSLDETSNSYAVVPEPSTVSILTLGLAGLAAAMFKRKST